MRTLAVLALAAAACTGYRTREDSRKLRGDLDDGTLASRVRVALASAPETRDEAIEVSCRAGTIYLRGTVRSNAARAHARALATEIEGVRDVVETFSVRPATD